MKSKLSPRIAVLGFILVSANIAMAQSAVETTTTSTQSVGKVSEFNGNYITLTTESSPAPVRYSYTKTTTYVDQNGNPVSIEAVRSGLPVTVYYDREGTDMVARKVVVQKQVDVNNGASSTEQTTTTSTEGTVSQFTPDNTIAVKSESSETPTSYTFSKTTTYVDENGNPVSVDVVKSGAPVTVYYSTEDGRQVATKVVVRHSVTEQADPAVTEKKTTTTTTTTPNP